MKIDYKKYVADDGITERWKVSLFLKKPKGAKVPEDMEWVCICGNTNRLLDESEQHCVKCGTRLRMNFTTNEQTKHWTMVRVRHFDIDGLRKKSEEDAVSGGNK
jgi:hypothetical protein